MRPLNISGSQAKDYYYAKDPAFSKNGDGLNSCWHGDAARTLGLSGKIKKQDFLNIISGNDLAANNIIKDGVNNEHRAAVDIPFSAPKSVSVIALHVGDDRLTAAHEKAVAKTLLKREGSVQDIAATVRYLLKDSDYITGSVFNIDGGRSIN